MFNAAPLVGRSFLVKRARLRRIGPAFPRGFRPSRSRLGDGGDRPLPAIAGGAAVELLQRTDDVVAGHDDQVLVAGRPMGEREFVARMAQVERHPRRPIVLAAPAPAHAPSI